MWFLIILLLFNFCGGFPQEDAFLKTPELIRKYGYPCEKHEVITEDGYILNHFRIPFGKNNENVKEKQVILIQHGLFGSSLNWILTNPDQALAYKLADEGYDVWLMNTRGNLHSNNHRTLNYMEDEMYWRFSFHEIAKYDLSVTIDYVLNITQKKKLVHIGHSQGGTSIYVLLSEKPEYNEKLSAHFSYAPATFLKGATTMIGLGLAAFEKYHLLTGLTNTLGNCDVARLIGADYTRYILTLLCEVGMPTQPICPAYYEFLAGPSTQTNARTLSKIFNDFPNGSSLRQILHLVQSFNSDNFRLYDQGLLGNLFAYKQFSPPEYNLGSVKIPIYIFFGHSDALISIEGIQRLARNLSNVKGLFDMGNWNHYDFLFGANTSEALYSQTIEILKNYK